MKSTRGTGSGPAFMGVVGCLVSAGLVGCGGEPGGDPAGPEPEPKVDPVCTIPVKEIFDGGVGRDGIRSLEDPPLVPADHPDAAYLLESDRVIGVEIDGQAIAVPHNILWWHEIVNLDLGEARVAVSFCPLTGSSLAFDRAAIGGSELGVSGLIFKNNLIMFDRDTESLWPQMMREATCGARKRDPLPQYPALEVSWSGWKALHPDGRVVSDRTGFGISYTWYPYGDYADVENAETLFPQDPHDDRRPPKERVFGVVQGTDGGTVFPFETLARQAVVAAPVRAPEGDAVVFWDRSARGAAAYVSRLGGRELTFGVAAGRIVDSETGSVWDLAGRAVEGPLAGGRLEMVRDAFTSFWFSWAAFQPETIVWFP